MVGSGHPEIDPGLDRQGGQPPSFRYVIYSQQRSGSNWLCARLSNLCEFGIPGEYVNGHFVSEISKRLLGQSAPADFNAYLSAVEKARSSATGRFGIKIQPHQLLALANNDRSSAAGFLARHDAIILLTREDKLAQEISGAIAHLTIKWRSDGQEPDLSSVDIEKLIRELASKLALYLREDRQMFKIAKAAQRPLLHITYEQMKREPDAILDQIVRFLGFEQGLAGLPLSEVVSIPDPPPGNVAAEIRQLFLDRIEGRQLSEKG